MLMLVTIEDRSAWTHVRGGWRLTCDQEPEGKEYWMKQTLQMSDILKSPGPRIRRDTTNALSTNHDLLRERLTAIQTNSRLDTNTQP